MSQILSLPLQMKNKARCLGGRFFPFQRKSYILSISFLIYFVIAYIWPMSHSLDKRICFTIIFLPPRGNVPDMDFFCYIFTYFAPTGVIKDRVTKINSKYFNEKIVTIPFVLVDQFYLFMIQPIRLENWPEVELSQVLKSLVFC